jgi:hypothetical protein
VHNDAWLQSEACTTFMGRSVMAADRESDPVNTVGEPDEGKPHIRFAEGRLARCPARPAAYSTPP